jgi:hypothetical protein
MKPNGGTLQARPDCLVPFPFPAPHITISERKVLVPVFLALLLCAGIASAEIRYALLYAERRDIRPLPMHGFRRGGTRTGFQWQREVRGREPPFPYIG